MILDNIVRIRGMISRTIRILLPAVIFSVGIVLMVLGILGGELQMILRKAIVVCFECIGIG